MRLVVIIFVLLATILGPAVAVPASGDRHGAASASCHPAASVHKGDHGTVHDPCRGTEGCRQVDCPFCGPLPAFVLFAAPFGPVAGEPEDGLPADGREVAPPFPPPRSAT